MYLLLWVSPSADAVDTWTTVAPGVELLARDTGVQRIYAAFVDLCAPGVSIRATTAAERGQTVSAFGSSVGATVAVNGDLFSGGFVPSGLAIGEGGTWSDTADNTWEGSAAFGDEQAEIIAVGRVLTATQPWTTTMVSGRPQVVTDGVPLASSSDPICGSGNPRTAVGLTADRHTLLIVVVDGRQAGAAGMSCAELGDTMAELGAWQALNFDGGGSSAMWIAGDGVVNAPSDGAERVVANHLAVVATGSGPPGSCDPTFDDVTWGAHAHGARAHSDVDGDLAADICVRSPEGVVSCVTRDSGVLAGPAIDDADVPTLRTADVTGDGRADLCARAAGTWTCWTAIDGGFGAPWTGPSLLAADGWDDAVRASTLRTADVDGDGRTDVCGRDGERFRCWPAVDGGFGAPIDGPELPDAGGWAGVRRAGSLRTGDVTGDGRDDLCALTGSRAACWVARAEGGFEEVPIDGPAWADTAGWDDVHRVGTFAVADVDGDGRADLVGRAADGLHVARSDGVGFTESPVAEVLADAQGWLPRAASGTLRLGDLDGDGDLDVCGRAPVTGTLTCLWWSDGAFVPSPAGPALGVPAGAGEIETARLADVDRDGMADACAWSADGISCWSSVTGVPGPEIPGAAGSEALGWSDPSPWGSLRIAGTWAPSLFTSPTTSVVPDLPPPPSAGTSAAEPPPDGTTGPARAPIGTGCGCASGPPPPVSLLVLTAVCRRPRVGRTGRPGSPGGRRD